MVTRSTSMHLVFAAGALLCAAATAGPAAPKIWHEPHTGMAFVALPKGCFQMGTSASSMNEVDDSLREFQGSLWADERPQHEACVDAFLIGRFEVRASDWAKVMGEEPPDGRGAAPAAGITWHAAQAFAARMTQLSGGRHRYRLPTEAEWEYACRAGEKKDLLPFRDNRTEIARYSVQSHRVAQPDAVGQHKANAWGLHDMLGNVWEWVQDGYRTDGYAAHALYNPLVKEAQDGQRAIRGASHRSDYIQARCANRASYPAGDTLGQIGLRLVREQ